MNMLVATRVFDQSVLTRRTSNMRSDSIRKTEDQYVVHTVITCIIGIFVLGNECGPNIERK
jgi:hypothetical protein